jgi:superfamily II DNA/RNA helicase
MAKQGIKVGLIDGSLSSTQKDEVRGKFQSANPEYNYLVLTDAAQTGLNLTAAKSVLHYDCPDTNKAKEQRDARSLRLKQTEDVEVYVPGYDVPEERISLARVQRKAKTGNPLQSKAELVDDSGLASRIAQMRSRPEAA